uniref:TLDc domain-containing protein n=1 Tax=Ditylenchus dipsaci TaxID=166011 RepID=A0A915ENT8_9BILA
MDYWEFQETFGPLLSASLWKYLQHEEGENNSSKVLTLQEFTEYADSLMGTGMMNNNHMIELFMPVNNLLRTVLEAANIEVGENDQDFLGSLVQEITAEGEDLESVSSWFNVNCPRICKPVKDKITNIFANGGRYINHDKPIVSKLLSQVQMFFLQHSLPIEPYFTAKPRLSLDMLALEEQGKEFRHQWTFLSCEDKDNNFVARFEESVLGYHGATIGIFQMTSKEIFVLAADEEWKVDGHKFGGVIKGLTYGTNLFIKPDMSNVNKLEVWGCQGDKQKLEELERAKDAPPKLESYEAPKKTKAAAGDWKHNADKQLLEMAGMKFSNERR